jgi:hypothetical protein
LTSANEIFRIHHDIESSRNPFAAPPALLHNADAAMTATAIFRGYTESTEVAHGGGSMRHF